jgi:Kef-type K+ transport system membrane component KefB
MSFSPDLHEFYVFDEHERTYRSMLIIFQLALILTSTKLLGWLAEKIKVPGVIGELLAGVIIGPFVLGNLIRIPIHGHWVPLFPAPTLPQQWPVNDIIWALAQFASIILLFVTGLHTDIKQFLRYVGPASFIALIGLIVPFALGTGTVYLPFFQDMARAAPDKPLIIPALFVGAILAATSIGITARVLGDINRLDTPEGVTIIGAAVLDDVLGIIALSIIGGIASSGTVSIGGVSTIAARALGFWMVLTVLVFALSKPIERLLLKVKYPGAVVGLGLAIAFVCSGAAEAFGLAFIIGAYSVGLGLSQTKLANRLMDDLRPIYEFVVPIFFAALGMLVNFKMMLSDWRVILFGLLVTVAAIVGELLGCGLAANLTGFNLRGSYRIGLGMMPRGEVALIVAGIGLSRQLIGQNVFGVSIMMTLITTILAPILLVRAFKDGSGRKRSAEQSAASNRSATTNR